MKTRRQFLGSGMAVVLAALLAPLLNRFKPRRTWSVVKTFSAQATQRFVVEQQVGWITLHSPDTKVRRMLRLYQDTEKRFLVRVDGKFLFVHDLNKGKLVLSSDADLDIATFSYPCDWEWEAKLSA